VRGTSAPDLAIIVLFSSTFWSKIEFDNSSWGLELTMGCQVGNAPHSIALDLNVGTEHLPDERLEPAELDNQNLVLS
jgi:hypothetical protein